MSQTVEMHIIARIHSDFPTKFGIPRQSGLADVPARIVFELLDKLPEERRQTLLNVLAQDPRPGYQHEPGRVYGFPFAGFEVKFTVEGDLLTVLQIESR